MQDALRETNGLNFRYKKIRVQLSRAAQGLSAPSRDSRDGRPSPGSGKCFTCGQLGHWYAVFLFFFGSRVS